MVNIECEKLFSAPAYTQVTLSKDGEKLYYIRNVSGEKVLYEYNVWDRTEIPVIALKQNIQLFDVLDKGIFYYLVEEKGYLNSLYLSFRGVEQKLYFNMSNIKVLNYSEYNRTLVVAVSRKESSIYDLYKIELDTFICSKIFHNDDKSFKWKMNSNNELKVKYIDAEDHIDLYFYNSFWIKIREYSYGDYWNSAVVDWDDQYVYIKERGKKDTFSLVRLNYINLMECNEIYSNSDYDISDIVIIDHELVAVAYHTTRKEWVLFGSNYRKDFTIITNKKYGDLKKIESSADNNTFLLTYISDRDIKKYYFYTRSICEMKFLFCSRDTIDSGQLSEQIGFRFLTRDSLMIESYVSMMPENNHKLIVKIHGGPTQRVYWGYNAITQFFATRGCICVEPNYRGSSGYGKEFEELLNKEMGDKVTNDICDCINYIRTKLKIKEVYLFGWSAGGYIAMMTAINHDIELLKGVIAISAPLDMEQIIQSSEKQGIQRKELACIKFGDPVLDQDILIKQSVLTNNINFPLLYVYGKRDRLIDLDKIECLKKQALCKILEYDDNHGIKKISNRMDLFKRIEEFVQI